MCKILFFLKPIDIVGKKVYIKPIKPVGLIIFFRRCMMKFYFEKLVRENFRNGVMRSCCRTLERKTK